MALAWPSLVWRWRLVWPPASHTLVKVHCTLYSVYSVQCTLYSVQCTVYTVHCTLYTVNCTLYTAYRSQLRGSSTGYIILRLKLPTRCRNRKGPVSLPEMVGARRDQELICGLLQQGGMSQSGLTKSFYLAIQASKISKCYLVLL